MGGSDIGPKDNAMRTGKRERERKAGHRALSPRARCVTSIGRFKECT
jgi:hypothetical protein